MLGILGETLNIMTLGGLALGVGILVDDARATIENIDRRFEDGVDLYKAILNGAGQIAMSARLRWPGRHIFPKQLVWFGE